MRWNLSSRTEGWSHDTETILPQKESHAYTVRLEMFEGPLDLLLHLIKKNELDIYGYPHCPHHGAVFGISQVDEGSQLGYRREISPDGLHAPSYQVEDVAPNSSEGGRGGERKIRGRNWYEGFWSIRNINRQQSNWKKAHVGSGCVSFGRCPRRQRRPEEEKIDVSLFELLEAFRQVLERAKPEIFHEVILEQISVEEKIRGNPLPSSKRKSKHGLSLASFRNRLRGAGRGHFLGHSRTGQDEGDPYLSRPPFETIRSPAHLTGREGHCHLGNLRALTSLQTLA